jgi:Flp pilus assembly pilin Flp
MKSRKQSSRLEIGLIASLIAVAIVGIVLTLGPTLRETFPNLGAWLP